MSKVLTKRILMGSDAAYVTPKGNIRIDRVTTNKKGKALEKRSYYPGTYKNHAIVADVAYGPNANKHLGLAMKLKPGYHK